ncbi:MAG: TonB-dependent receptor, partial [Cytophagales bacterium]|nr:TonB-dependent receptor [Cytophagales bacterium]
SGFLDYFDTNGFSRTIEKDIVFGDPSSMSPGRSHNEKEKTDLNLKLSYRNLEVKGKYLNRRKKGYIGFDYALNNETTWKDTYLFGELIYKSHLSDKLDMTSRAYFDQYESQATPVVSRPDGFLGIYPDGIKGIARFKISTIGFENQLNYNVFDGNELTFGFQYEWIHQGDIRYRANINPLTLMPLPSFTDFTHDLPFTRKATRHIWAFYLQDEWNITKDIDLTIGVRHDQFTRFGATTNPRLGFIWRFIEDANLKILFATAFR